MAEDVDKVQRENLRARRDLEKADKERQLVVIDQAPKKTIGVGLMTSVSALAIIAYLGMTMVNGQLVAMLDQLGSDWHFLEFLAALGVLYLVAKSDYLSGPATAIIAVAATGFALKTFANPKVASTVSPAMDKFAAGQAGLFETFKTVLTNIGAALNLKPATSGGSTQ